MAARASDAAETVVVVLRRHVHDDALSGCGVLE
jgi:hypothetical protein